MRQFALLALVAGSFLGAAEAPLANYLPANPRFVAGMNVQQSVNSPLGQFFLKQMKTDEAGLQKIIDAMGFDPRRDVREMVVAEYEGAAPGASKTLVVARGNFDVPRMKLGLLKDFAPAEIVNGFEFLAAKDGKGGLSFLDGTTAIAGDAAPVKEALAGAKSRLGADLQARMAEMGARYDAWVFTAAPLSSFAGRVAEQPGAKKLGGGAQMLQGILQASAGLKFGSTIVMDAELTARSAKDAQAVVDVFKFISSMMQLNKENPEAKSDGLAALLDGMRVAAAGDRVTMNFALPQAEMEKILGSGVFSGRNKAKPGVI